MHRRIRAIRLRRHSDMATVKASEYLSGNGWRCIGWRGSIRYWDHPNHQPDVRGAFTTTDASEHQKEFEKNGWCNCVTTQLSESDQRR